jgi:hypothetical protein
MLFVRVVGGSLEGIAGVNADILLLDRVRYSIVNL